MPEYKKAKIRINDEVSSGIYKMVVEHSPEGGVKAGQFYMIKSYDLEPVLWRPISVSEVGEETITFLYAAPGRGTKQIAALKSGQDIQVMGPLGNGFDLDAIKGKVALVCGGIGIAPMVEVSKRLTSQTVDVYAGFRSEVFGIETLKSYVDKLYVTTEDGSTGHKGYVTEIFDASNYDVVLCCGPEIMMEKVLKHCREKGKKIYVSMEKHMACGIGACLVCTCKTKGGHKRTCKEGPVFDGEDLVLE